MVDRGETASYQGCAGPRSACGECQIFRAEQTHYPIGSVTPVSARSVELGGGVSGRGTDPPRRTVVEGCRLPRPDRLRTRRGPSRLGPHRCGGVRHGRYRAGETYRNAASECGTEPVHSGVLPAGGKRPNGRSGCTPLPNPSLLRRFPSLTPLTGPFGRVYTRLCYSVGVAGTLTGE